MASNRKSNFTFLGSLFTIAAILVSWFINNSIFWAIVHGFFGLWYILYAIITGDLNNGVGQQMIDYYFS
tara:strand:- start:905 stop:1111 length:207 start_codon:yes stop_codon:yes gene_type:complete